MTRSPFSRRDFLKSATLAGIPLMLRTDVRGAPAGSLKSVRFGLCADIHKDITRDADTRLSAFIDAMNARKPDFILQLGDFCQPREKNRGFVEIWNKFEGPRYHTLGNHERDHGASWEKFMTNLTGAPPPPESEKNGFTWEQVLAFWGMEKHYYSFDKGGRHFVVLDGNEKKPVKPAPGYARYIGEEQLAWLATDLKATDAPTVIFCHQSLQSEDGVENSREVRAVIEKANDEAGWRKVGLCFSGHHHIDFQCEIAGVNYVQINSMSFYNLGNNYRAPLFTHVTLAEDGLVTLEGAKSEFSSSMSGHKDSPGCRLGEEVAACISPRRLFVDTKPA